jgi:dCMP deaminase
VEFVDIDPDTLQGRRFKEAYQYGEETTQSRAKETTQSRAKESIPSVPTPNEPSWQQYALHKARMAHMLSQRSDDPTGPVGCVLMVHSEVVAIGWNGFPAKALYGEFPRASTIDDAREKKEPYVIHAEQNALLTRNKRNMNDKSSVLFSNKIPCEECVPLLIQAGVKNVVVPCDHEYDPKTDEVAIRKRHLKFVAENKAFFDAIKSGKLKGYWPDRQQQKHI